MDKRRCTAILLAAGSGSRMKSPVAKQFMQLKGRPLIWYSLNAIEKSKIIDDCIVVAPPDQMDYMRKEIIQKYKFKKVDAVVAGGKERYESVAHALGIISSPRRKVPNENGFVFIHDGARPFLTEDLLQRLYDETYKYGACVAAVPSKDTVKLSDERGYVSQTPDRKRVWNVQTPQVFRVRLISEAFETMGNHIDRLREQKIPITDDASVMELFSNTRVKLVMGSYKNIKITTPEDIGIAEKMLEMASSKTDLTFNLKKETETQTDAQPASQGEETTETKPEI